jgi:hypothetical protein
MDAVGFTLVEVWRALAAVQVCLVLLALPRTTAAQAA